MEVIICEVTPDSVPRLVASVAGLFAEDGGRRDGQMDTEWPKREGATYYGALVEDRRCLCLLAYPREVRDRPGGHLIGRMTRPSSLRPSAIVAVLESMRVDPAFRRQGIGTALIRHFCEWARSQGANEASVTAYSANEAALAFYRRHDFAPFEMTLHRPL